MDIFLLPSESLLRMEKPLLKEKESQCTCNMDSLMLLELGFSIDQI